MKNMSIFLACSVSILSFSTAFALAFDPVPQSVKKASAVQDCIVSVHSWATHTVAAKLDIIEVKNGVVHAKDNAAYMRLLDAPVTNQELSKKFCEALVEAATKQ